jgi:hypothetical protein
MTLDCLKVGETAYLLPHLRLILLSDAVMAKSQYPKMTFQTRPDSK